MTPEHALAREAIRATMSLYTFAGDRGAIAELVTAFAEDAVLELFGATYVGRDAIGAALAVTIDRDLRGPAGETLTFLRHNLTSCRIDVDDANTAAAWTYFDVLTPVGLDHCGVYVDRFGRVGDDWLIAHRRIKIDWVHAHSLVIPGTPAE
jgi:hypothetical protein